MSIEVEKVRTDSMKRRLEYEQRKGISYINACELCRKPIKLDASGDLTHFVLIDHEK